MSIPNVKRYRLNAVLMAVPPKVSEAAQRYDWKAYQEAQQKQFKIRVGQQKQKRAK